MAAHKAAAAAKEIVSSPDHITVIKFNHDDSITTVHESIGVTKDQLEALHTRAAKDNSDSETKDVLIEKFYNNYTKEELAIIAGAHFDEDTSSEGSGDGGMADFFAAMGLGEGDGEDEGEDAGF